MLMNLTHDICDLASQPNEKVVIPDVLHDWN